MGYLERLRRVEDLVGTVLYKVDEHGIDSHGLYTTVRIPLTSSDCDVIQFDVQSKDVTYQKHTDKVNQYDIVIYLTQLQYDCMFRNTDGNEVRMFVHRDILTQLYNNLFPDRHDLDHMVHGVPQNGVGQNDMEYGVDYGEVPVTIYSSLIEPDTYITFRVRDGDIRWQKDWASKSLGSYVNIMLPKERYLISYRNKSTNWHDGERGVSREDIMQDVLFSNRAAASGMIRKEYRKWCDEALKMEFLEK